VFDKQLAVLNQAGGEQSAGDGVGCFAWRNRDE
jgi:hypothetical protein